MGALRTNETWNGFGAVGLRRGQLSLLVVPELGAKIASLTWRDEELLLEPRAAYNWESRGQVFESAEMCGWDEMFPTIVSQGLPDHGEVWNKPWHQTGVGGTFGVECETVHARFSRTVAVVGSDTIRCDYRIDSRSSQSEEFLWAAHPQFAVAAEDQVFFPGTLMRPTSGAADGELGVPASISQILQPGQSGKWWSDLHVETPRALLIREREVIELSVSGSPDFHWGLWVDRAHIAPEETVSIQPAIGWYDDLKRARANGTAGVIPSGGRISWSLDIQISDR